MAEGRNNLELYLKDIYENECMFKIDSEEKDFIQAGVEALVLKLVDYFLEDDPIWNEIEEYIELFRSDGGKISKKAGKILKVGSFYEGTKNGFPDEFDIIYPFYYCEETKCMERILREYLTEIISLISFLISKCMYNVWEKKDKKNLTITCENQTRTIHFDKFVGKSRPAMIMNFIYENNAGEKKDISVDIVPAVEIKDPNLRQIVEKYCPIKPFCEEIIQTGTIYYVNDSITFTETEVHVMRDLLSQNHKTVYRTLKFLINGNQDDLTYEYVTRTTTKYSSYMIKTMIIIHHYTCSDPCTKEAGQCMIEVLNEMCRHKNTVTYPKLSQFRKICYSSFPDNKKTIFLRKKLKEMKDKLVEMQGIVGTYNHEIYRNTLSLNAAFLERCRGDHSLSENEWSSIEF